MSKEECRMSSSSEIECECGETVFVEDLGDTPMYLSGECEKCGRQYGGNGLAGFECENEHEIAGKEKKNGH